MENPSIYISFCANLPKEQMVNAKWQPGRKLRYSYAPWPHLALLHYLNLKTRCGSGWRARLPRFSFINSAEKPFIKLSAPIIYIPAEREREKAANIIEILSWLGKARAAEVSALDQSAFGVKWNGNRLALNAQQNEINCQPFGPPIHRRTI